LFTLLHWSNKIDSRTFKRTRANLTGRPKPYNSGIVSHVDRKAPLPTSGNGARVSIDQRSPLIAATNQIWGMNTAKWFDRSQASAVDAPKTGGGAARPWPGRAACTSATSSDDWQQA
jgi:hypothetical protein